MLDAPSRQSSPHAQEDANMVGVGSSDSSSDSGSDKEYRHILEEDSMVVVESRGLRSRSENVGEVGRSANRVGSKEATAATAAIAVESSVTAMPEPRRSFRNISTNKKPTPNYVAAPKPSIGKKKPALAREDVLFQDDSEDEWPRVSECGTAEVGFFVIFTSESILINVP